MLAFNPKMRISAEEAIKDPYFDDVRIEEQEKEDICDINLTFDDVEVSIEELRELVVTHVK